MPTTTSSLDHIMTEDIFTLLGIESIPEYEKQEILENMSKTVHARVFSAIMNELTPEEQTEFEQQSPETLIEFLANKGFDVPQMIVHESVVYRVELAKLFEVATGQALQPAVA